MAIYEIESPDGRKIKVEASSQPTDADINELFAQQPSTQAFYSSF